MPDPLSQMPDQVRLGDTLAVTFSDGDYPANDGWTLTVYFIGTLTDYSEVAVASGSDHVMTVSATNTLASLNVETMQWQAKATKGVQVFTQSFGSIKGLTDFVTASAQDTRTTNQQTYDAICATILGRASLDQQEYTVGNRQLKRMTIADLLEFKVYYGGLVAAEKRTEKGEGNSLVKVRFNTP